ncbi:MAG: dynamin family protein [Muribaculum sp.]|nr:dynamin family protein [Muribaculum sp.]
MENNIFSEYQQKKAALISLAEKACKEGWIDDNRRQQIVDKINNDTLTIGVIGQMKCGKSTFLNTFVFGDTVLPSATTPMTAALSVITYGPEKKLEVEFYTRDEWEEQKMQAARNLGDVKGNEMEESKIKAAKELMEKSDNVPGGVDSHLGKTSTDCFENLKEYVGADGKYIAITKSVKLYYPHDYLKGVEIVDTPGFNDPIVSREERTKEFLKKADVVLLMLYAGRAFDSTDRTILFKNVRECGIGKIIIGVNKYDIPYGNGETEGRIISIVKEQIEKACASSGDETIVTLIKERDPLLLSAEMSLMSQLPMVEVQKRFQTSWNNACFNFEISSQAEMAKKSRVAELINAIKDIIEHDKEEVLLKKPYNAMLGAAAAKKEKLEAEIEQVKMLISNLSQPEEELEERLVNLKKAHRRLERKLESLGDDIQLSYSNIIRKGRNEMEDEVDAMCRKLDNKIENLGRMAEEDAMDGEFQQAVNILVDRNLKRCVERLTDEAKRQLNACVREFCEDAEDVLLRYVEDFDARSFIKKMQLSISEELDRKGVEKPVDKDGEEPTEEQTSFLEDVGYFCLGTLLGPAYVVGRTFERIGTFFTGNASVKKTLHDRVESMRSGFNADDFLNGLIERKDQVLNIVKDRILNDLISKLTSQVESILSSTKSREEQLTTAQTRLAELDASWQSLNNSIDNIFKGFSWC